MTMRMMPIMFGYRAAEEIAELRASGCIVAVVQIPWAVIEPHEVQAKSNHSQSLICLAERGGLSACEALAILEDRPWRRMPHGAANAKLAALLADQSENGE
jgi:hypothetical protein